MNTARTALTLAIAFIPLACASDLSKELDPGTTPSNDAGKITASDDTDQTTTVFVDATDNELWVYFSFAEKDEVEVQDPQSSNAWDLAFHRFNIAANGGVSGSAGVEVAPIANADFDGLERAPAGGYLSDRSDSEDEDHEPDLVFGAWYNYNLADHTLSPAAFVYVVHAADGRYYKLEMLGYYDDAGTSAHPHFRFQEIGAPVEDGAIEVDATSHDTWAYVKLADTSADWDLRFQRTAIETNGGAARWADDGSNYDALNSAPTIGFTTDATSALAEWYDYDITTHTVTPKPRAILVRNASGAYGKLEIKSYESGRYRLRVAPLSPAPETRALTIEATDAVAWVYVDLRRGQIAEVETASTSADWDLGFSRTRVQTNSGTSGPGSAGAIDPGDDHPLEVITSAPDGTYAEDSMIPLPGPPGSGEFSGNPVLNTWYNYDPNTHAVSPKPKAFLLRLTDGTFAKLQIDAFEDGRLTVRWVYAGPMRTSFVP